MKANHPEVFLAACMSLAVSNTDRLAALKQEAERGRHPRPAAGHQPFRRGFLGGAAGRTAQLAIRYALAAVKKVGLGGDAGGGGGARRHARSPTSPISPPGSIRGSSTGCRSKTWCAPALSTRWTTTGRACSPRRKRSCAAPQAEQEEEESGQIGLFGGGAQAGAVAPAGHARLAAAGAAGLRGGGGRLPSHRASARCLRAGAAPARRDPVRPGRGARARPA